MARLLRDRRLPSEWALVAHDRASKRRNREIVLTLICSYARAGTIDGIARPLAGYTEVLIDNGLSMVHR